MDEVPPLYHGHDPFPVRGSFQPIDLGQNSDNEDAESWLVAPTPRAGSFCSQYWAPGTKSVYDDDISPTMSCRSSLAGDAFPPLNQSPDPNLATMPNSARSTGRYQGMRNSTSRIPRPSNGPPSARANDPMRQSMPTFPSRGKVASPAAPYRPSSGNYPPGSRGTTPAQRNLAARQAELRASIARQNEVRASLGRGGGTPGNASRGGRQPGAAGAGRGMPGQGASHASSPGQSKAPGQVERAPSSRIGAGSAPANGYAAKFAKAPSARAQQAPGGARTPATAPPASHQAKQAALSSTSPSPQASPSPELPTPNKLSPKLSAAEDANAMRAAAHDHDADEDMRSAHSCDMDHEEQPPSPPPRPVQPQGEQSEEEGKSAGGPAESNGQSNASPTLQQQQQQQQHVEVKHKEVASPRQQEAKGKQQQPQQQQQQHEGKQADTQPLQGPAAVSTPKAGNGGPPTPPGPKEVTPRSGLRQELTGFSSLTGQVLEPVDEQRQADMQELQSPLSPTAQVVSSDAAANVSVPSTSTCASQGAKGASEISPASPINPEPPRHESKSVPIGTSVSESMLGAPQFGPDETEDTVTAMGSTVVNVGDKSYSMRDDVPSASITHQGWELRNSPRAPSRTDTPKETQQPQQQAQQQQGEKGPEETKPATPTKGKAGKDDAKTQPTCACSIM